MHKNGAFTVIFKDDSCKEVFLVYRTDKSIWNLTGGGIEDGESPESAAVRESLEETGFTVYLSPFIGTYRNIDVETGGLWNEVYLFRGTILSGTFTPEFPGCKGEWFSVDNLPENIQPVTRLRIVDALQPMSIPFEKEFKPKKD